MELTVRQGTVEVRAAQTTSWTTVTGTVPVNIGDTVRTGNESDASVNLYDQGVLHIAQNSTVALTQVLWKPNNPDVLQGDVFLEAGGLWSRLFDFVSSDSSFDVRTSSTVATVRGTTFWVTAESDDTSRVYVDHHAVEVTSLTNDNLELDVTEGDMARLTNPRAPRLGYVSPTAADQALITKYRKWDSEYEAQVEARQLAYAKQVRHFDANSSLYTFQRLAEQTRLVLAGPAQKDALRARFMAGRMLDAYIELSEHHDRERAELLLERAQDFRTPTSFTYPEVRHVLLFFGHERDVTDTDKPLPEVILQEVEEEPTVQTQIDTTIGDIQIDFPTEPVPGQR
jgi:hypothetical protein